MIMEQHGQKVADRAPNRAAEAASNAAPALIGESLPIRSLTKKIDRIAGTDATVLVTGETGTGKELVARQIHARSERASGPLVIVNCPALAPDLFHAEVFGSEKGAYTGAWRRNIGRIEAAEGGTLFLDEIGDLPPENQVVLLRFLEEGSFERLGCADSIKSDVRIIAATHVDLELACRNGRFRKDLFYRLNALHLQVPPLRERADDIRLLTQHFIDECCARRGLRAHKLGSDAVELIFQYAWPGNVRELRNKVLQAVVMCENAEIGARELGLADEGCRNADPDGPALTLREIREQAERRAIRKALCAFGGRACAAARRLGISRAHFYRLTKRYGVETGSE